jgi:hypothetical protein
MKKLVKRSELFLRRNSSTILTGVGSIGVVATAVLAVKATPKALELLDKAEKEKGEKLTKLEVVRVAGLPYVPSIVVGASTIACIFGANILNKRHQASLASAYALLDSSYKEYKKKVAELYGEDAELQIRTELAKDNFDEGTVVHDGEKQLFYDEFSGRYFESTMADVIRAEYKINQKISSFGGADLNEFYAALDIPQEDYGVSLGWSIGSLMSTTWSQWLDFTHKKVELDDGLECYIISFSTDPMYDYEYY